MRGIREGPTTYGAVAYGSKAILSLGAPRPGGVREPPSASSYSEMLKGVLEFFRTGLPPVAPEETLEIMAFMQAADLSKSRQGAPVALKEVVEGAR